MEGLLTKIANCRTCEAHLPHGPRPVVQLSSTCKIVLIGQAPGRRVHASGIPWDDPSGVRLRKWLDISDEVFYDETQIGILPMGFCYPGTGKSGDLPPRPECAPQWHDEVLSQMPQIRLTILIGRYAQDCYLKEKRKRTLTEKVLNFEKFLPAYFPLPHPSPRNIAWFKRNPWFDETALPVLKYYVHQALGS